MDELKQKGKEEFEKGLTLVDPIQRRRMEYERYGFPPASKQ